MKEPCLQHMMFLLIDRHFDRVAVMQRCNNTSGFREFSWGSQFSSFTSDFKIPSSCFSNHLWCNGNCFSRPDLWATSRTFTRAMALQSSTKLSKAIKPAQKSNFPQVCLKQTHYERIMLRLLPPSVTTRASTFAMDKSRFSALNYLCVTTLTPRVPKSYFDWSKHSNPFLGR